jgi:outer membrane biogenesis lipoprotein LolB
MRSVLLFFALLILFGCGSSLKNRKAASSSDISNEEALSINYKEAFSFQSLSLRGDGKFENKKEKFTFAYKVMMVKDSLIWCSISKLGIEAFRIQIRPDSILVLDRLEKRYAEADYAFLQKITGMELDFQALESLLTGNIGFVKDSLKADAKSKIPHRFFGKKDSTYFSYNLSAENFKVKDMEAQNSAKNQKTYLSYSSFKDLDGHLLPEYILLTVVKPERNQLQLTHTKIQRNPETLPVLFNIPENYTRVRLQ